MSRLHCELYGNNVWYMNGINGDQNHNLCCTTTYNECEMLTHLSILLAVFLLLFVLSYKSKWSHIEVNDFSVNDPYKNNNNKVYIGRCCCCASVDK